MASTGFWPVKSRLKEVIDYAENLDKTTEKKLGEHTLEILYFYGTIKTINETVQDRKRHPLVRYAYMPSVHADMIGGEVIW